MSGFNVFSSSFCFFGGIYVAVAVEKGRCSCDDVNMGLQAGLEGHGGVRVISAGDA